MITLTNPDDYYSPTSWCVTNLTSEQEKEEEMFHSWDGMSAAMVDSLEFSKDSRMTVHHQHLVQAVLLCGGADMNYQAGFIINIIA